MKPMRERQRVGFSQCLAQFFDCCYSSYTAHTLKQHYPSNSCCASCHASAPASAAATGTHALQMAASNTDPLPLPPPTTAARLRSSSTTTSTASNAAAAAAAVALSRVPCHPLDTLKCKLQVPARIQSPHWHTPCHSLHRRPPPHLPQPPCPSPPSQLQ